MQLALLRSHHGFLQSVLACSLLCVGCGSAGLSVSPRGAGSPSETVPALLEPSELLPADLDLVLTIDLARLRGIFGEERTSEMLAREDGLWQRSDDPPRRALMRAVGRRASFAWLGFRGLPDGPSTDFVLVIRGDFEEFDPNHITSEDQSVEHRWHATSTGLPGLMMYEHAGASERSAPVRMVLLRRQVALLATAAEADAVERIVRLGPDANALAPPADGVIGFAVRARALVPTLTTRFPNLSLLLADTTDMHGSLSLEQGALRADAFVLFRSQKRASQAEQEMQSLLHSIAQSTRTRASILARSTSVRLDGPTTLQLLLRAQGDDARSIVGMN